MPTSLEPLENFHRRFFAIRADAPAIDDLVQALCRIDKPPERASRALKSNLGLAALANAEHYMRFDEGVCPALASAWLSIAARSNDSARLMLAARLRRDVETRPSFARMIGHKINRLLGEIGSAKLVPMSEELRAALSLVDALDPVLSIAEVKSVEPSREAAKKPEVQAKAPAFKHETTVMAAGTTSSAVIDRDLRESLKAFKVLEQPIELREALPDWQQGLVSFGWFARVIERIAGQIASMPGRPVRLQPLLIVGSPGIGKTMFARVLGKSLGLPFRSFSFAAQTDPRGLLGTARGWASANPALVVEELCRSRCANPLIFVDEVEKGSTGSRNGDPHQALLNFLERENAKVFEDPFLQAAVDLSHVNWLAGANSLEGLPAPLLSRFEVIEVRSPGEADWPLLYQSLRVSIAEGLHLPSAALPDLSPDLDLEMRKLLRRRGDIRAVRRALEQVIRIGYMARTIN